MPYNPSVAGAEATSGLSQQFVQPPLSVVQQTGQAITDLPSVFKPSLAPGELERGKSLISSLLPTGRQAPPIAAGYAGVGALRAGQLAGDVLGVVCSPFNLALFHIQKHL